MQNPSENDSHAGEDLVVLASPNVVAVKSANEVGQGQSAEHAAPLAHKSDTVERAWSLTAKTVQHSTLVSVYVSILCSTTRQMAMDEFHVPVQATLGKDSQVVPTHYFWSTLQLIHVSCSLSYAYVGHR